MGDFDSYIDRILNAYKDGRFREIEKVINENIPELKDKDEKSIFIDYLEYENLLTFQSSPHTIGAHKITPHGYGVYHNGGWSKYLESEKEKKRLENELVKTSIRTNGLQKILLWFTVGFSAATLFVAIMDYSVHAEELRLQKKLIDQKEESGQGLQQSTKTADPNQDSSKISNDSLDNNLKVKK